MCTGWFKPWMTPVKKSSAISRWGQSYVKHRNERMWTNTYTGGSREHQGQMPPSPRSIENDYLPLSSHKKKGKHILLEKV